MKLKLSTINLLEFENALEFFIANSEYVLYKTELMNIDKAFYWCDTEQGHIYWSNLFDKEIEYGIICSEYISIKLNIQNIEHFRNPPNFKYN